MYTRCLYETFLALNPGDVGMVVGRSGRTINGIKHDFGMIELRVMPPCVRTGGNPWVLFRADNQLAISRAFTEILKIALESERRRKTEIPMTAAPPTHTLGDAATFHVVRDGKRVVVPENEACQDEENA